MQRFAAIRLDCRYAGMCVSDRVEHRFGLLGLVVGFVVRACDACARRRARRTTCATTTVATPLPIRLVSARASDMKRSMPRISARPATGTSPTADSVAASTMKPLPVTPAAPFEVSSSTASSVSCCVSVIGVLVACAMNTAAIVR